MELDNYAPVAYASSNPACSVASRSFRIYAVFVSFAGMYLLLSLVIGHFEDTFASYRKQVRLPYFLFVDTLFSLNLICFNVLLPRGLSFGRMTFALSGCR
jgi:hypothetical protein